LLETKENAKNGGGPGKGGGKNQRREGGGDQEACRYTNGNRTGGGRSIPEAGGFVREGKKRRGEFVKKPPQGGVSRGTKGFFALNPGTRFILEKRSARGWEKAVEEGNGRTFGVAKRRFPREKEVMETTGSGPAAAFQGAK